MSTPDLEFRWTLGVSAVVHAALLSVIWIGVAAHAVEPKARRSEPDAWFGTTVSVVEEPRKSLMSPATEGGAKLSQAVPVAAAGKSEPRANDGEASPHPRKIRVSVVHKGGDVPPDAALTSTGAVQPKRPALQNTATPAAGIDLRQAMQTSINQPASATGTFGAAGVDLTERRLPRAFTRAIPVAVGAEPGWWKQHLGSLGRIQFTVVLTENGKLDEVIIDDEKKHPFHARVVRGVARLLALGTFALPSSSTGSAQQAFELQLVMEQQPADANSTADPGDLVEKGFEAPTATKPGQAIIRDAPGHTLRAFLKLLPASHDPVRAHDSQTD